MFKKTFATLLFFVMVACSTKHVRVDENGDYRDFQPESRKLASSMHSWEDGNKIYYFDSEEEKDEFIRRKKGSSKHGTQIHGNK